MPMIKMNRKNSEGEVRPKEELRNKARTNETRKSRGEKIVKDIKRATHKQY
jgi:hypothetical protein|tara:strand:- start:234 stop:386 length:153 start_codon:yes stop_codon:yes gene_type:complete